MAVRKIRIWPDPALSEVAKPVEQFGDELKVLVRDMFDTMYKANGVGLAATQLAVPLRVIVIDVDPRGDAKNDPDVAEEIAGWGFTGPRAFINPEILEGEGQLSWNEGCLSLPGVTDTVQRKARVKVSAFDEQGQPFTVSASGLFAVVLQHETDHLNGRVFVDYLSKLKRDVIRRKMERIKPEADGDGVRAAEMLASS